MIPCSFKEGVGAGAAKTEEFLERLKADFPDFKFVSGRKFTFRPPRTIVVEPFGELGEENAWKLLLLHELGHAVLGHRDFKMHIERLKMEMAAWEKARELAAKYGVEFSNELAEAELDTYRDWVHQKSRCPRCGLTRYQTPEGAFHCPRCENLG